MPDQMVRRCERFHADGSRCTQGTVNVDGWCRQPGCEGFVRPTTQLAPSSEGPHRGTAKHIALTGGRDVGLGVDEVDGVQLSHRAVDSFRFHHGGSDAAAQAQLRMMLEDFLLSSSRTRSGTRLWRLSREGFTLVLSPDLAAVTGYSTTHRERTWAQVRSGVRSRFRTEPRRAASGEPPLEGSPLTAGELVCSFDPSSVHLTWRVRSSFDKIFDLAELEDAELDERMRAALEGLAAGVVTPAANGFGFVVQVGGLLWRVSADGRAMIGVKRDRAEVAGP